MKIIKRIGVVRLIISVVVLALIGSFIFRKQIQEHRVSKAKLEMMKRMSKTEPKEWRKEMKQIYDSLILEKVDTVDNIQN